MRAHSSPPLPCHLSAAPLRCGTTTTAPPLGTTCWPPLSSSWIRRSPGQRGRSSAAALCGGTARALRQMCGTQTSRGGGTRSACYARRHPCRQQCAQARCGWEQEDSGVCLAAHLPPHLQTHTLVCLHATACTTLPLPLTSQAAPPAAAAAASADDEDSRMCGICFEKPRSVLFMPCRHFAACSDCAAEDSVRSQCPWCQEHVTSTIDVFVV